MRFLKTSLKEKGLPLKQEELPEYGMDIKIFERFVQETFKSAHSMGYKDCKQFYSWIELFMILQFKSWQWDERNGQKKF